MTVPAAHREQLRLRSARRMGVERAPRDHGQALRPHRLDADVVNARRDRALDLGCEQAFEHLEEPVLQRDRQRQQPVQEGRDRRQILAQRPVAVGQLEPGRRLELLQRAALDLAGEEHGIELS